MAKLSRANLKRIVKECLVEILSEGINSASPPRKNNNKPKRRPSPNITRSSALDKITYSENVNKLVDGLTNDPVLTSIFKDTAHGTLQEQFSAERIPGSYDNGLGDNSSLMNEDISSSLFEEASKNWATLAFSDKKPR